MRGRQALGWNLTLDLFTDLKYTVQLPEHWCHPETRNENIESVGEAVYDKYGNFDPNLEDRITLLWTLPYLKMMFGMVRKTYNCVMERYTMGTGGGSGLPENYVIWQEKDKTAIAGYIPQIAADLYLTVVHMWHRMYDYPFVVSHEQLPKDARVDDKKC